MTNIRNDTVQRGLRPIWQVRRNNFAESTLFHCQTGNTASSCSHRRKRKSGGIPHYISIERTRSRLVTANNSTNSRYRNRTNPSFETGSIQFGYACTTNNRNIPIFGRSRGSYMVANNSIFRTPYYFCPRNRTIRQRNIQRNCGSESDRSTS